MKRKILDASGAPDEDSDIDYQGARNQNSVTLYIDLSDRPSVESDEVSADIVLDMER